MSIQFVRLDDRAVEHIAAELRSANPMGQAVLRLHDLAAGRVWSVVPEAPVGDLYAFSSAIHRNATVIRTSVPGGFIESVPSTEDSVAEWLSEIMDGWPDALLLCESFLLRAGDIRRIESSPAHLLICDDYAYFAAGSRDARAAKATAVRVAYEVPPGLGMLARIGGDRQQWLNARKTLNASELESIVGSLVLLMLGAYDGESVLLWAPEGVSLPHLN